MEKTEKDYEDLSKRIYKDIMKVVDEIKCPYCGRNEPCGYNPYPEGCLFPVQSKKTFLDVLMENCTALNSPVAKETLNKRKAFTAVKETYEDLIEIWKANYSQEPVPPSNGDGTSIDSLNITVQEFYRKVCVNKDGSRTGVSVYDAMAQWAVLYSQSKQEGELSGEIKELREALKREILEELENYRIELVNNKKLTHSRCNDMCTAIFGCKEIVKIIASKAINQKKEK